MTHVGKKLRHIRKNMRMTQEELAEGICNRSYVSQIEKGNVVPSPEILEQLAKKLQTDLKDLWTEVVNPGFTQVEIQNALRHIINKIDEGDWEIARKWLLKLSAVQLSPAEKSVYLWAKAELSRYDERIDEVEALYLRSIVLARELDDPVPLVRALNSLGSFYSQKLQPNLAVPYLNEALQLANRYEVSGLVRISLLYTTAMMHGRLEEYYSALELLKQAERLNHSYDTMYKAAPIFIGLAICNRNLKRYDEADKYNQQALSVLKLSPSASLEAATYNNMGIYYMELGNLQLAEEYIQKAIAIYQNIQSSFWTLNSMNELAKVLRLQGRLKEAKKLCETVFKESSSRYILAETQVTYAEILNDLGETDLAISQLDQSFSYFSKENNKSFILRCYKVMLKLSTRGQVHDKISILCDKYELI